MNDTPGWASPGSAPSERPGPPEGHQEVPGDQPKTTEHPPEEAGGTRQSEAQRSSASEPVGHRTNAAPQGPDGPSGREQEAATGSKVPLAKAPPRGWSREQPPPGPWSAPGGGPEAQPPPPPPGPGWGGAPAGSGGHGAGPGWGAWQSRPVAVKPGVIPLRPLGVGEILDGAVSTMRTHWRTVLGISLTVAVLTHFVLVLLQGLVLDDTVDTEALNDPTATLSELGHAMRNALIGSGVIQIVTLLGTIIATALLTTVTSRAVLGRPVTLSDAWRDARPQVPRLFGLTLLLVLVFIMVVAAGVLPGLLLALAGAAGGGALATLGGLAAAVVALWLATRWALSSPALMLEKQSVPKALSRSAKLVKGSWWRVFGILLLAAVIAVVVSSIVLIPFTLIAGAVDGDGVSSLLGSPGNHGWAYLIISAVGSVIGSMLTFPITAGTAVLLYIDQRIRREALDLELARAAGAQGHGSEAAGSVPGS